MNQAGKEQHIFKDHLLKPLHHIPELKHSDELIWPSVFLLLCLGLLVLLKIRAFPRVLRIIQSTFSSQLLQQLEREDPNSFKFYSVALNLFFILNLSFLIFRINSFYDLVLPGTAPIWQYVFFLVTVMLLLGFKIVVNKLIAFFTDEQRLVSDYMTNSTLVNQTFGLFLFPWIILLEFSEFDPMIFIVGAVILLSFAVMVKWYRGIIMGLVEERVGLLQVFSYFCGLEILPIIVMVKYIIETF